MKRYRKSISILIVVLLILGAIGLSIYKNQDNAKKINSFTELYNKHFDTREVTSILLEERGTFKPQRDLFVKHKEKIDKVINLFSQIEWKYDKNATPSSEKAYQITLSFGNELIFAMMVSDNGAVDTFDYATNKGHSYRITNEFDVNAIELLFEIESD
ncbi:hypothetical protein E0485_20710 [Paenibacillus albiflavus]|uniref:Uncharacterized protein n=1 Tax=Paenibacillus albiflavus TaxID=2545760 RepID=A0A4R4E2M2_9BACL|nr:hypothetical protein [Paenibacillus albiflavus]TCZ73774.1 hypothetical protein E0485_20710 [Paenibacillus albiflavus]